MKKQWFVATSLAALLALAGPAAAIDGAAGDYSYPGDGVKLLLLYGQYTRADRLDVEGVGRVPGSALDVNSAIIRGVSYQDIGGIKTALQFFLPMASFPTARIGGAEPATASGIGDLTIGATVYPLVSAEPTGTTAGLTLFVGAPTGNYELGQPSIGTGTWQITPQAAIQQGLGNGFFVDAFIDATFSKSKTHDGVKVSTDPSVQVQTYLRYQPSATTAFAVGYSARRGGKQFLDDSYAGTRTDSDQIRLQASTFLSPSTQVQMMLGRDVASEGGFRNDTVVQLRLMKAF